MTRTAPRNARSQNPGGLRKTLVRLCSRAAVGAGMVLASVVGAHGITAAVVGAASAEPANVAPVNIAGRWSGPRFGFNMRAPQGQDCGGKRCELTYDIVACGDAWCGIAVSNEMPCGAIGIRLTPDIERNHRNAFKGRLELTKGSAAYTIEAWYAPPSTEGGERPEPPRLSIVGDTGGELLMMRRSFPFQAELARVGDAQCTLEKATS
jgi:hypothetical protein